MNTHTDIHFSIATGDQIRPYLPSMGRLSIEVLRESPYQIDADLREEIFYLQKYPLSKDSIAVLVFDGSTLIGSATGIPMACESPEYLKTFQEEEINPSTFYHFSESLLLKNYRGRGIYHHFFDLREDHVRKLKAYDHICFCHLDHDSSEKHEGETFHLHDFWRRRGYVHHPDMKCELSWKTRGEKKPSPKQLSFWIKSLITTESLTSLKTQHASSY